MMILKFTKKTIQTLPKKRFSVTFESYFTQLDELRKKSTTNKSEDESTLLD